MNPLSLIGAFASAIVILQLYYIYIHYGELKSYVSQYKMFRYGIDIVPNYIDPTTYDYNDTIALNINTKRRCVLTNINVYKIISSNGYSIDNQGNRLTYSNLMDCIIYMTNTNNLLYDNVCQLYPNSTDCHTLNSMLV